VLPGHSIAVGGFGSWFTNEKEEIRWVRVFNMTQLL